MSPTLYDRIAESLDWSIEQVRSFSLPMLREMLVNRSKLKAEVDDVIRSGSHIFGPPIKRRVGRRAESRRRQTP